MSEGASSAGRTLIKRLGLRNFRNIRALSFEPASRLNLISGDNGHGKTSLIEGLYLLCTSRSFRSKKLPETITQGEERASLSARTESFGLERELSASLSLRGRSFLVDGKKPKRLLDYALVTPVIAFHPGDLLLASGPATARRTFLDRVVLYEDPTGSDSRLLYQRALKERQILLKSGEVTGPQIDAFEKVAAQHGARFSLARLRASKSVEEALKPAFRQMAHPDLKCLVKYEACGTEDVEIFQKELRDRRRVDRLRGSASFGPQRDDLVIFLDGRLARSHASQGQQRLLTLALKLAELACVKAVTGMEPILLLDDVSSELDRERTGAVFQFLRASMSQIFVTTTRPELFSEVPLPKDQRADFIMSEGVLRSAEK
jgi:DNA replication and repair protein RecF